MGAPGCPRWAALLRPSPAQPSEPWWTACLACGLEEGALGSSGNRQYGACTPRKEAGLRSTQAGVSDGVTKGACHPRS